MHQRNRLSLIRGRLSPWGGTSVVINGSVQRKATEGANQEGHRSFTGRPIVGGMRTTAQGQARWLKAHWSSVSDIAEEIFMNTVD